MEEKKQKKMKIIGVKLGMTEYLAFIIGIIASFTIFGLVSGVTTIIILIILLIVNQIVYSKNKKKQVE